MISWETESLSHKQTSHEPFGRNSIPERGWIFLFAITVSRPAVGSTQPYVQWVMGTFPLALTSIYYKVQNLFSFTSIPSIRFPGLVLWYCNIRLSVLLNKVATPCTVAHRMSAGCSRVSVGCVVASFRSRQYGLLTIWRRLWSPGLWRRVVL
jgi:hypothetical protein